MRRVVIRMESGVLLAYPVNRSLREFLCSLAPRLSGPVDIRVEVTDR